jgi:hypothetical protein
LRRTFFLPDPQAFPDAPDLSSPMAVRRIGAAATAAKPLEYLVMKYRLEKNFPGRVPVPPSKAANLASLNCGYKKTFP